MKLKEMKKLSTKKSINVNVIEDKNSKEKKKKENPFVQIQELKLAHQQEMAALRTELSEIKNVLSTSTHSFNNQSCNSRLDGNAEAFNPANDRNMPRNFRKRKNRCRKCEIENVPKCYHCFICGSVDHRSFVCPSRVQ